VVLKLRIGGLSKVLDNFKKHIEITSSKGSIKIIGVDTLQSIHEVITVLDRNISTDIGYALNIKHLKAYCDRNLNILK